MDCAIVRGKASMVEAEPWPGAAPAGRSDVDSPGTLPEQPPKPCRRDMAQQSARGTGQDGREAVAVPGEVHVANRVDASARAPCGRSLYPMGLQATTAG